MAYVGKRKQNSSRNLESCLIPEKSRPKKMPWVCNIRLINLRAFIVSVALIKAHMQAMCLLLILSA